MDVITITTDTDTDTDTSNNNSSNNKIEIFDSIAFNNKRLKDSDKNEVLIWRVFSNKYLLKYIMNQILKINDLIEYDAYKKINVQNRWKFKDVYSLDWMIIKKQYALLKNKIEFGDFILFDMRSIEVFFEALTKLNVKAPVLTGNEKDIKEREKKLKEILEFEKETKERENEIETLKELIKLTLDKRREEFEICDLVKSAIKVNSLDGLKILINKPYSIIVYPSTLEYAIKNSTIEIVKELINNNKSIITNEIKIKSFNLSINNIDNSLEMVKLILENKELYSLPTPKTLPTSEMLYYLFDEEDSNGNDNDGETKEKYILIEFEKFLELKCIETMEKLMKLNVVQFIDNYNYKRMEKNFKITHSFNQLLTLVRISLKYIENKSYKFKKSKIQEIIEKLTTNVDGIDEDDGDEIKLKELQKLVSINFSSINFYKEYILKYEESIDELELDDLSSPSKNNTIENYNNFLTLFRLFSKGKNPLEDIGNSMKLVEDGDIKEWYPNIFKSIKIGPNNPEFILNINNKELIDWLNELIKVCNFIKTIIKSGGLELKFETMELEGYAFKEGSELSILKERNQKNIYRSRYLEALKECDFEVLKEIDSIELQKLIEIGSGFQFNDKKMEVIGSGTTGKGNIENDEKLLKLLDYFKNSGGPLENRFLKNDLFLRAEDFYQFFKQFTKFMSFGEVVNINIKFDYPGIQSSALHWLRISIITLNLKMVVFLLNNLKEITFNEFEFDRFRNVERNLFNSSLNLYHNHEDILKFDQVMIIFDILISKEVGEVKSETCKTILNYLFEMIIQTKFITIQQVKEAYQYLIDHSIVVKHSLFHSFYYLKIRSAKFIKYILSRPGIDGFFQQTFDNRYNSTRDYTEATFDIKKYIKFELFTFDYIFGENAASFDEILNQLFNQLSLSSCKLNLLYDLNSNLAFCLDIRRVDLFFKQLEFIKLKLAETCKDGYVIDDSDPFPSLEYSYNSPSTTLLPTSKLFKDKGCLDEESSLPFPLPLTPYHEIKNQLKYQDLIFKPLSVVHSFEFSEKVLDLICMVILDLDLIQSIIEFNFHVIQFQDTMFSKAMHWSRFDIATLLLENYEMPIFCIPHFELSTHYSYYQESVFMFTNYFDKIKSPSQFNCQLDIFNDSTFPIAFLSILIEYLSSSKNYMCYHRFMNLKTREKTLDKLIIILRNEYGADNEIENQHNEIVDKEEEEEEEEEEYYLQYEATIFSTEGYKRELELESILTTTESQQLLKKVYDKFMNNINEKRTEQVKQADAKYLIDDDNLFLSAFIVGDIKMCDLVLQYYPKQFLITKSSITEIIANNKIHIIKYYYQPKNYKNLINNMKDDKDLFNHLKMELSNHNDYKFDLNWL